MLVITRLPSESIQISGEIKIIVLGVKGRQVRIGVEAPRKIVVDREEIYLRKQEEAKRIPAVGSRVREKLQSKAQRQTGGSHDTNWK